jgi:hypothetical protein
MAVVVVVVVVKATFSKIFHKFKRRITITK